MNRFKIYKILEKQLASLPIRIGTVYVCFDTLNMYIDSKRGRILTPCNFIDTEFERLDMKDMEFGYYYVSETNTLWTFNNNSWSIYVDNKDPNYPGQIIKDTSYNVFSDSFKVLVNKNKNSIGSLVINPDVSIEILNEEDNNRLERIVKSYDFGKMVFNGDYYTNKNGILKSVTDDGYVIDLPPSNEGGD